MGGRQEERARTEAAVSAEPVALEALVGTSPAMREVKRLIQLVARNHCTVFISGESGVGKELVARTIHQLSPRARAPLVATNCGALPESLLESQLFGHHKGAFTGATQDTLGIFRAADGGTVFLDEVTEMSPALQVKLLRVLQEHEVTPVGGTEPVRVDLRILAASNRPMAEVRGGRCLREDLYYRLCVVHITLPPLRDRREDIRELVRHFIHRHALAYGVEPLQVDEEAHADLLAHSWPGNVRELSNVIERLYALGKGPVIRRADLCDQVRRMVRAEAPAGADHIPSWEEAERSLILQALRACGGQKVAAARLLKIDRHRLMRKLRKYGIS